MMCLGFEYGALSIALSIITTIRIIESDHLSGRQQCEFSARERSRSEVFPASIKPGNRILC